MTLGLPTDLVVGFLLALVRSAAWVAVTPPFGTRAIPMVARMGIAAGLALPVTGRLAGQAPPVETVAIVQAVLAQLGTGLALGFSTLLVLAAVRSAGELMDLFGGFSLAQAYDPLALSQSSVFGRFDQLLMTTLLFATNGHLLLVKGFLLSYTVIPLDGSPDLGTVQAVLVDGIGTLFVAALQIAAPLVAVSFTADLALGLLSRTAPSLNVLSLSFPVKILLTLGLVGFTLPLLADGLESLVETALKGMGALNRSGAP